MGLSNEPRRAAGDEQVCEVYVSRNSDRAGRALEKMIRDKAELDRIPVESEPPLSKARLRQEAALVMLRRDESPEYGWIWAVAQAFIDTEPTDESEDER